MRNIVLLAGALALVATEACSVDAGVDVGAGGAVGTCEDIACGDALVNGLASGDDAICDANADSAYQDVLNCGCGDSSGPGQCSDVCGDNLCAYGGETSDCGDCMDQFCGPEHDTCANN